ncbi:hypothetical protein [Streptomyces sp. NPDC001415]
MRWTIIGVLISAILTGAGWVVQARLTHDDGSGGGASPETSAPTHTPGPGGTTTAPAALYPSRSKLQEAYQTYASRLPLGNCDVSRNVRGSWHEKGSTLPTGDMVCFTLTDGQYVITCTYYERPALFQVRYTDAAAITRWWKTLDPAFATG